MYNIISISVKDKNGEIKDFNADALLEFKATLFEPNLKTVVDSKMNLIVSSYFFFLFVIIVIHRKEAEDNIYLLFYLNKYVF
jgi:hypothetical protein